MEANNVSRAPDSRPPAVGLVGLESPALQQLPPRPALLRSDSRSSIAPQLIRGVQPQPPQQRPQFQPGGQITVPQQQFAPRPVAPVSRAPLQTVPPGSQQIRPQVPARPSGPQSFAPQQVTRPLQPPTAGQPPLQRAPPPNNLQFGPRQPPQFGSPSTPDGSRPLVPIQSNGAPKNGNQYIPVGQISRQPSQSSIRGPDSSYAFPNKPVNLDNPTNFQNVEKSENGIEMLGAAKGRSYSIAAAPGAPSLFKSEDDRRKSVSAIGGKVEEFSSRAPGLGFIQEGKLDSRDNVRGSKESIRSEASNDGVSDRPESRLSGSKMTESFFSSQPISFPKKKDDDDDVILQSSLTTNRIISEGSRNTTKVEPVDRSPSLSRSDDSPEPRQRPLQAQPMFPTKPPQNISPEPQRPKTPKTDIKPEVNKQPISAATPTNMVPRSPIPDYKPPLPLNKKPNELNMNQTTDKNTPRKISSAPKVRPKDGDNDSGVDESTQGNDLNGSPGSPNKKISSKLPTKEKSSSSIKTSLSRSSSKSATAKTPENPSPAEKKKVPMNKIQVGNAPSPNIKAVKSKIGSLDNATYKPGGGKIKIENRKLDFNNVTPKIAAKNDAYAPSGGSKKITTTKLEWNAKSKIGSLQNAAYKPGGGDKKIETVKLDFKDKAKPKVASTVNITHKPGGGAVKIENQKLEFKAQSKVGSMDNVKHRPGGGEIKIFDDKDYIKQMTGQPVKGSQNPSRQEDYYMSEDEWFEEERPMSRCRSARAPLGPRAPLTPRTPRARSPRRRVPANFDEEELRIQRNNERNRRASMARPASARDPPRSACTRPTPLTQRPAFSIY